MFRIATLMAATLSAVACQAPQAPDNDAANEGSAANQAEASSQLPSTNGVVAAAPAGPEATAPEPAEPQPTAEEEKSPAAAVAVVRRYCDAIARKKYTQAYRLWAGNGEASGMSEREFAQSFAKYDAFDCSFGTTGPVEGAAGSAYISVPVVVTGTFVKRGGFILRGPVTLRRVNDVPGSTAEQRRWHISDSGLNPGP